MDDGPEGEFVVMVVCSRHPEPVAIRELRVRLVVVAERPADADPELSQAEVRRRYPSSRRLRLTDVDDPAAEHLITGPERLAPTTLTGWAEAELQAHGMPVRARHRFVCPGCGDDVPVRGERLREVLSEVVTSGGSYTDLDSLRLS